MNSNNYRQAWFAVVAVVVAAAGADASKPFADHANGLPHKPVHCHFVRGSGGPRLADLGRNAPFVGHGFR